MHSVTCKNAMQCNKWQNLYAVCMQLVNKEKKNIELEKMCVQFYNNNNTMCIRVELRAHTLST